MDVAEAIRYAREAPAHVDVSELIVVPSGQKASGQSQYSQHRILHLHATTHQGDLLRLRLLNAVPARRTIKRTASTGLRLADWASLAEIAGAVAVIVSLVYVGIQVSDNASAVRSAAANDANVALQSWYLEMGSNPRASELYYRGLVSEEALPNDEEFQFIMMTHAFYLSLQNTYLLAEEGTIDRELRRAHTTAINGLYQLPGLRRYWRQRKSYLHAGFAAWVERAASEGIEMTVDIYQLPDDSPTED